MNVPGWELLCSWVAPRRGLDWLSSARINISMPKSLMTQSSTLWLPHPPARRRSVIPLRTQQVQPLWVSPFVPFVFFTHTYSPGCFSVWFKSSCPWWVIFCEVLNIQPRKLRKKALLRMDFIFFMTKISKRRTRVWSLGSKNYDCAGLG